MTKYTAADVREKRISFRGLTTEQFLALQAHFHELYPEDVYMGDRFDKDKAYARFYKAIDYDSMTGQYVDSYLNLSDNIKSTLEITYGEFEFGQFVVGETYAGEWKEGDATYRVIFKPTSADNSTPCYLIDAVGGFSKNMCCRTTLVNIAFRKATEEEAKQLSDFIAAQVMGKQLSGETPQTKKLLDELDELFKPLFDKFAPAKSALLEAEELINGERAKDYGNVSDNFSNIAIGWNVIAKNGIDDRKVGHMMAWLKICRDLQNPKHDNIVDAAGYMDRIDKMTRE